jgi:hypothetical protein
MNGSNEMDIEMQMQRLYQMVLPEHYAFDMKWFFFHITMSGSRPKGLVRMPILQVF